ncbi:hypothetical protein [Raoultella terrigena]|uniref:hypothetical protein n=1 Tax=Raoultella terrigena TaxID=577 RepID=UPI001F522E8F|nr:hypothetical protein [Raoultella terrigena]MCI1034819.1 hypothetical protein [Raoultella terrigena]
MSKNNILLNAKNRTPEWMTIREAAKTISKVTNRKLKNREIYRHALYGRIVLSIYFQSPMIIRKIKTSHNKIKLRPIDNSFTHRVCILDSNNFINRVNLTISTEGRYIFPMQDVIDTKLIGYEYILIKRLLARSLNIPEPVGRSGSVNYGITVALPNGIFQLFEKMTWQDRLQNQLIKMPENIAMDITKKVLTSKAHQLYRTGYFPLHDLPSDACFVIRRSELEKLISLYTGNNFVFSTPTRITTPLSRLLWLACKHNETISPLIRQPYKLLSIFEQWASDDGITDHLSGETLKNALERGSPSS